DAAGDAAAGVADRLREIVFLLVHDDRPADDRVRPAQLDDAVTHVDRGPAAAVGFEVAQVADVAHLRVGPAVHRLGRVEVAAGRAAVGGRAVAVLVDVEAVFARRQAGHLADDLDLVAALRERDLAVDF